MISRAFMKQALYRSAVALLVAVLAVQVVIFSVTLYGAWLEHRAMSNKQENLAQRLAVAEADLDRHRQYVDQIEHNPIILERVVREKLGYARPGEVLLIFDESRPLGE